MALIFPQLQPFTLYASGVNIGDTTMTLASFKSIDGDTLTMADFGTKGYMTVEPGAGSQEEQISFTGVTNNANGTTTITGISNVEMLSPFTETSGFTKQHSGGLSVVVSVSSGVLASLVGGNDDETITGIYTFTDPNVPRMNTAHTYGAGEEEYFATKRYVDGVAVAGAPNASTTTKGIVQEATLTQTQAGTATGSTGARLYVNPESLLTSLAKPFVNFVDYGGTITAGDPVYLDPVTATWKKALATSAATSITAFGIAIDSGVNGSTGKRVQVGGIVVGLSGLTTGYVYVSDTGTLSSTPGTFAKVIGYAYSTTALFLTPTLDVAALFGVNSATTTANFDESMTFFNTTDITGAEAETLTNGSEAGALHYHTTKVFQSTRDQQGTTGSVTYAHGLGRAPKWVHLIAQGAAGATFLSTSDGYWDGSTQKCLSTNKVNGNASVNSEVCHYVDSNGTQAATVSSVDATNVTLSWTKSSSPDAGTLQLQFVVG